MSMAESQFDFEVKQFGEEKDRILRFVGSTEDVDRDGDIIETAGWETEDYMKNPIVLWAHDRYSIPPIAKTVKITKDIPAKKLIFDIKFPTIDEISDIENPTEHAKFINMLYNMCKGGYLRATSVGFRGIKFKTRDDGEVLDKPEWQRGRRYLSQTLLEISIVPVPSNKNALAEAVGKGLIDDLTIKSFFNDIDKKDDFSGGNNDSQSKSFADVCNRIDQLAQQMYLKIDSLEQSFKTTTAVDVSRTTGNQINIEGIQEDEIKKIIEEAVTTKISAVTGKM